MKQRIAIIGAGMSGLTLANALMPIANVHVFEKARGVGGRMSTRYAEPFFFDHGTQFFTARSKEFQGFIAPLIEDGLVAPWEGNAITIQKDGTIEDRLWLDPHYVAVPHMNSLCKYMATDVNITLATEVAPLTTKTMAGWHLTDKDGHALGVYDWIISTAPPVQTHRLFAAHQKDSKRMTDAALIGCYTLMIGFNTPWNRPWIAAKIHAKPIEWIAINSTKPQRNAAAITSIVAHSNHAWAQEHIDADIGEVEQILRKEFESVCGIDTSDAKYFSCHRWRYAITRETHTLEPFFDDTLGIASSGDWCTVSRIEDTWLNAMKLSEILKNYITRV
jgi:predicted NAD/FAD-dependent oxidoreductase